MLLNIAAAIALCLAYLSNYINPSRIWMFAFFGLVYPLLLLINIVFVLFWWWRRNKYALLSFAVILIGIAFIGRYFQVHFGRDQQNTANRIKVLSYNVRLFNYFEWDRNKAVRDSIFSFIKGQNPGIVCLQEFYTRNNPESLSEKKVKSRLNHVPYSHIEYTYRSGNNTTNFGIAIFSKYPIVNRGSINFKNSLNACIYSDILVKGDTFRIYNLHLQSIRFKKNNLELIDSLRHINNIEMSEVKDFSLRLKQAYIERGKQTSLVAEHIKKSPYPVIICGDFNDTPISYAYHKLLGDNNDAYREAGGGLGSTYRGKMPNYRIDYIFHSPAFKAYDYNTRKVAFSDHFPVSCEFIYTPLKKANPKNQRSPRK